MSDRRPTSRGRRVAVLVVLLGLGVVGIFLAVEVDRREVERLVRDLGDASEPVVRAAASRLAARGAVERLPEIITGLGSLGPVDTDEDPAVDWTQPEHRFAPALALASRPLPREVIARISALFGDARPADLALALHILAERGAAATGSADVFVARCRRTALASSGGSPPPAMSRVPPIVLARYLRRVVFPDVERLAPERSEQEERSPLIVLGEALALDEPRALEAVAIVAGLLPRSMPRSALGLSWHDASILADSLLGLLERVDDRDVGRGVSAFYRAIRVAGSAPYTDAWSAASASAVARFVRAADASEVAPLVEALGDGMSWGTAVPRVVLESICDRASSLSVRAQVAAVSVAVTTLVESRRDDEDRMDLFPPPRIVVATWRDRVPPLFVLGFFARMLASPQQDVTDAAAAALLHLRLPVPRLGDAAIARFARSGISAGEIEDLRGVAPFLPLDERDRVEAALRGEVLRHPDPIVRLAAVRAVSREPRFLESSLAVWRAALEDPSAAVRVAAAVRVVASSRPSDEGLRALVGLEDSSEDAATVLERLASFDADDVVLAALEGPPPSRVGPRASEAADPAEVAEAGPGGTGWREFSVDERFRVLRRLHPSPRALGRAKSLLAQFALVDEWRRVGAWAIDEETESVVTSSLAQVDFLRTIVPWESVALFGESARVAAPVIERGLRHRRADERRASAEASSTSPVRASRGWASISSGSPPTRPTRGGRRRPSRSSGSRGPSRRPRCGGRAGRVSTSWRARREPRWKISRVAPILITAQRATLRRSSRV